jgi:hypothetical protein
MAICDKWSELVFQPDGGPNYMCTNHYNIIISLYINKKDSPKSFCSSS